MSRKGDLSDGRYECWATVLEISIYLLAESHGWNRTGRKVSRSGTVYVDMARLNESLTVRIGDHFSRQPRMVPGRQIVPGETAAAMKAIEARLSRNIVVAGGVEWGHA